MKAKAAVRGRSAGSFRELAGALGKLFLLFFAVWLAHWPLLRLPYYWDEAGYYIPAAYDFFRRGTLIPYSTLTNAHPPLPSLYLAAWWRVCGFSPFVTRTAMCVVAAVGLAGVYRLACGALRDRKAAGAVVLLTAVYPVWFVQSSLAHADLLAAAGTLWGLCLLAESSSVETGEGTLALRRKRLLCAAGCFALAALAKEIAIGTPLALSAWELWLVGRSHVSKARRGASVRSLTPGSGRLSAPSLGPATAGGVSKQVADGAADADGSKANHLRTAMLLATPALPLAGWFAFHRQRTGFTFGNPEYLRYNATATLSPMRVLLALGHRALHLTAHLNLFVPVAVTLGCLLLPQRRDRAAIGGGLHARLLVVLGANWIFFSVLGGALLTRYLLALYPLVLLLCMDVWRQRLGRWEPVAMLTLAAFVLGIFINPPYRFAPEDTLAYRDSILLEQHAIAQIEARYPHAVVLTAWPVTDSLTRPELGYVSAALPVVALDNFSAGQIVRVQEQGARAVDRAGEPYTVALVFSTKYDPKVTGAPVADSLGARRRALDEQYFGFHYDLPPETIAHMLGGAVVWQEQRHGQWAAVLHFDRAQLARLRATSGAGEPRKAASGPL